MFEQTFKNIDDILHKDAGCGSELDYVEQTSWVLFLKYLDDLEKDKQTAAELSGKSYSKIIEDEFQWSHWAAPKLENANGKISIDHNALIGDDLADFVNIKLFPSDDAAKKVIYLAIEAASRKWTMPIQNWKQALNRFMIEFEDELTPHL